jgi:AraC-like DNA-binding protein
MRRIAPEVDDGAVWDVSRPAWASRVPGVTMAGFSDRYRTPLPLRLIPHPGVTLGLMFGDGSLALDDSSGRVHTGSLVAGLGLGFGTVRLRRVENLVCLQVRLPPVVAGAVLGVRPSELDGAVVPLDDLWGREAARIAERLSEATSWEERFAWVDAMLARRNTAGLTVDPEVDWAWHRMVAGRGQVRVDRLADELGWSRKRLWSRFHAQIGLPPKRAAKLVRFDDAAHRLVAGQNAARVAADGGYTDQSHLHRDVMAFAGVTPATVAAEPFLTIDDIAWPGRGKPTRSPLR